jgi:CHAT domain-containing protein/tetratricopeptide (TPR) repeat protein
MRRLIRTTFVAMAISYAIPAIAQSGVPNMSADTEEPPRLEGLAQAHFAAGRIAEAETLARRALALRERRHGPDHPDTHSSVLFLNSLLMAEGRYDESEPLVSRILRVRRRDLGAEHFDTLAAQRSLATIYDALGRFAEATPLLIQAAETSERLRGGDDPQTLGFFQALGTHYLRRGSYPEAEAILVRARESYLRRFGPDDRRTIASVTALAAVQALQGRNDEAVSLLRLALEGTERLSGRDSERTARALHNLAVALRDQGRSAVEAEALFRRSIDIKRRLFGADHLTTLTSEENLAVLYLDQGRFTDAERLFHRVMESRSRALGVGHPGTLASAEYVTIARLNQPAIPVDALPSARLLLEGLRQRRGVTAASQEARAQNDRERVSAAGRFALFGDAAWTAFSVQPQLHRSVQRDVFEALQESLSSSADRSIAVQVARRNAEGRDAPLAELIRERGQLENRWARLDERLAAAFGSAPGADEQSAAMRAELEQVQARIQNIDARLRLEAPEYFALIESTPLSIDSAQALLAPDEVILLVVPSRFGTHVMAVTRDNLVWRRSGWTADRVRTAVQRLRWDAGALVDGSDQEMAALQALPQGERPAFDRTTAHALYNELIAPVAASLQGKTRIYIAAGGSLAGLPFHVLVSAPPTGADTDPAALRATRWFGDEASLIHIPSIQSLALLRQAEARPRPASSFIGIGNPMLGEAISERGRTRGRGISQRRLVCPGRTRDGGVLADLDTMRSLSSLPGTAVELEAVREQLGAPQSALLLAERATEPNVRSASLSDARVILFSTHGLTATEAAGVGEAGLVLTPPDGEARDGDDGFLAASEVTTLRLDADWVILSACNTATGDGIDNPGLGPLARAFFYAGARNLLASHWPVSDDVAPVLIPRVLALERAGRTRADALREAMREIRMNPAHDATDSWAHPFYWAPFVLIGDGGR